MSQLTFIPKILMSVAIIAVTGAVALAQGNGTNDNPNDETNNAGASANVSAEQTTELAYHAAGVLYGQMHQPDGQRIPQSLINGARCIAVFPAVFKEGFVVAGRNGSGLVGCRSSSGDWNTGAPAYFNLSGGSVGLQVGAKVTKIIVLFMNKQAVQQLTDGNFKFGASVAVVGGPAGAQANVHTAPAPVLTYRLQSSGGFAGAAITGVTINADNDANQNVYGNSTSPKQLLFQHNQVPSRIKVFTEALNKYAPSSEFNSDIKVKSDSSP